MFSPVPSVFKNTEDLAKKVKTKLLPSVKGEGGKKAEKKSERNPLADTQPDDPLRIPTRAPASSSRQPNW